MNLKVVVITTHPPLSEGWGGAVVSGVEMANILARVFGDVTLVCSDANNNGPPISQAAAQEVTVAKLRTYKSRIGQKQGFGLGAIRLLFRTIKESDCVYISGVSTWPVTIAGILSILLGRPYVVSLHGGLLAIHLAEIRARRPIKHLFYILLVFPILERARFVRVSSDFEKRDAAVIVDANKVVVIPNTFKISQINFHPFTSQGGGTRMVFVGRLEPDKGIRAFLETWRLVAGENDIITLLGNGEGAYADSVKALASQDHRIRLVGEVSRSTVFQTLADSDVLVLPSGLEGYLRENFGNVVLEALAVGRPVLVSRGLAWDHLPAAGVGWTFEKNTEALKGALEKLLVDQTWHEAGLAEKCRKFVMENYSSESVAPPLLALMRECVASSHGPN